VVATLGTTALGAVDPLPAVLDLAARHGCRVHVDAAYGGYFALAEGLGPATRAAFDRAGDADSIAIDPHKLGLQPYGCGCALFRDPAVGRFYRHDSPYTYFSSTELHLGEVSLECSRAGAAAVALWATQRLLPPVPGGAFAAVMSARRRAALALHARLAADPRWLAGPPPDTNIVVWAPRAASARAISARSREIFAAAAAADLHLALATLPRALFERRWPDVAWDADQVVCLRSCLMKPEHEAWIDRICDRLAVAERAATAM
jgi:glutamate/tyrosine decarboxylase-like PLP-dependent enzyme